MFKDNFKTTCRAHHLALGTERSYWSVSKAYIKWCKEKFKESFMKKIRSKAFVHS